MGTLLRAIVYGFGFSLGAALYKRASEAWGLDRSEGDPAPASPEPEEDGGEPATA